MTTLISAIGLALLTSLLVTPVVQRLAARWDIVDRPDEHRKLHAEAIPLGGGVVVLIGFAVTLGALLLVPNPWSQSLQADWPFWAGLTVAAVLICAVGLIDDRFNLRGRQKLAGQVLAAGIVVASGPSIEGFQLLNQHVPLGWLAIPLTVCWMLGAINSLNLLDGIDGLATSIGLIITLALAAMAHSIGRDAETVLCLVLAGSLLGFLPYNLPRARIFLGDAGSMLIGLFLGAFAIRATLKGPATVALAAPTVVVMAIPLLDVSMAILRRKLTGRSVYTPDRGHLHHCLQRRGYSGRTTLAIISACCAVTAVGALLSVALRNEMLALGSGLAVVGVLIVTRFFGHAECVLVVQRVRAFALSLVPSDLLVTGGVSQARTHLHGSYEWDSVWEPLTEFAEKFDLDSIEFVVELPAANEGYHATWRRRKHIIPIDRWLTEIPLCVNGVCVGRLRMDGSFPNGQAAVQMQRMFDALEPIEDELQRALSGPIPSLYRAEDDQKEPETVPEISAVGVGSRAELEAL